MEIAWSQREITPPPGEELGGFGYYMNRRAERTADPLFARVCLFRSGGRVLALFQLDLLGLESDHVTELRARLLKAHGIAPAAAMFHCTHTHCAPATRSLFGPGDMTETWRYMLTHHIMQLAADAMTKWHTAGRARWFEAPFDGIAFNRDDPDGPVDRFIRGAIFDVPKASPVLLVNYACHPVVMGPQRLYSADYPGAVVQYLAALGYRTLFLTAPCGDLDPLLFRVAWGSGVESALPLLGRRIGEAVERALDGARDVTGELLDSASATVPLPVSPPKREDLLRAISETEAALEKNPADNMARVERNAKRHWLTMLDAGCGDRQPVEAQALRVGDLVIAGVAAEYFSELAGIIRRRLAGTPLLIAGTCNGLVSYIATRRCVEAERYGCSAARLFGVFPTRPGGGEEFSEKAAELLAAFAGKAQRS